MSLTRRDWLSLVGAGSVAALAGRRSWAQSIDSGRAQRILTLIREFEAQGFHRTGTDVDHASGDWLADQVRRAGLTPALEPFPVERIDPETCRVSVGDRTIEGLPIFDGGFTAAAGIRGRLGLPDSAADIVLSRTPVNAAGAGALGELRRANQCKAIVAVTEGRRPGLCPSNADSFLQPFGPPVLQVPSEEAAWLNAEAARGVAATLIAEVTRTHVTANNVTAMVEGRDRELPPLVIMTPRSGWYWCASERGGGLAVWLEVMRAMRAARPRRTILFVASSGHELGHLGIDAFIDRRPGIVRQAIAWFHLGANVGAAVEPGVTLQASDDELDALLSGELERAGLAVSRRAPRNRVPGGEAEAVHNGAGRYISVIGGNGLFHNLRDRGPEATDATAIARFCAAFSALAWRMAESEVRPAAV
jgi:hypothetical protein